MTLKRIGIAVAAAGVCVVAYGVRVADRQSAATVDELGGVQATPASVEANVTGSADPGRAAADPEQRADDGELPGAPGEGGTLEQSFIVNHSLDAERLRELENSEVFSALVAELREQSSAVGAEKRRAYELVLYSRPLIQNGTVTLDVLECGNHLCVAELRANDDAVLAQFSRNLFLSGDFEAGLTANIGRYVNLTGASGEVRRLLFTHDTAVDAIVFTPPDIH